MEEIIKLVVQKTGIPEATAKVAVETVINFLKQKLPAPIAGQLDGLIENADKLDDLTQGLGGLFGKK